jgi:radical SAM superfamily enzyme YgiQ (UPF0313 family)
MAAFRGLTKPDMILVSSVMTYWYPGVQEAIQSLKDVFPGVPIVLGGVYATLCAEHTSKSSGTDLVVPGSDLTGLSILVEKLIGYNLRLPGTIL